MTHCIHSNMNTFDDEDFFREIIVGILYDTAEMVDRLETLGRAWYSPL